MSSLNHTPDRRDYFNIPAVSNSLIGTVKRELLGEKALNQNSPALRDGDAVHKLILEPHRFDFRAYTGRERLVFMDMGAAFRRQAGKLLRGVFEVEYEYEFCGFNCKLKADIVDAPHAVRDIKTTKETTYDGFIQAALNYDYPRQAAWYLDAPPIVALGIDEFQIIGLSKVKPYNVFLWSMHRDDPAIENAREEYKAVLSHMEIDPRYSHLKINNQ